MEQLDVARRLSISINLAFKVREALCKYRLAPGTHTRTGVHEVATFTPVELVRRRMLVMCAHVRY